MSRHPLVCQAELIGYFFGFYVGCQDHRVVGKSRGLRSAGSTEHRTPGSPRENEIVMLREWETAKVWRNGGSPKSRQGLGAALRDTKSSSKPPNKPSSRAGGEMLPFEIRSSNVADFKGVQGRVLLRHHQLHHLVKLRRRLQVCKCASLYVCVCSSVQV